MALTFHTETDIDAPPETFCAAFEATADWGTWMQGLTRVERLSEGPFGVGAQWRETRRMFGKEASEVFEITAWEPPHRVHLLVDGTKGSTGRGEYRFRYDVTPRDGGMHVALDGEIVVQGWLWNLLGKLFIGSFRKSCARDLQALKTHLEFISAAPSGPPGIGAAAGSAPSTGSAP